MDTKKVKDLMVTLDEYAVVNQDATLLDAILALDKAISKLQPGRQKHRAVLVVDSKKKVIGKIGHLAFLKALEPKYNVLGDLPALSRVGVSQKFIDSMMENLQFFQDNLSDLCGRAAHLKARDVMHPVSESVDENATLAEGIHELVMHQSLSIIVTRKGDVVGILRISDLFEELTKEMKKLSSSQ
jgi:predicted transcriptional regulator